VYIVRGFLFCFGSLDVDGEETGKGEFCACITRDLGVVGWFNQCVLRTRSGEDTLAGCVEDVLELAGLGDLLLLHECELLRPPPRVVTKRTAAGVRKCAGRKRGLEIWLNRFNLPRPMSNDIL
jgi:hypothetical protein